MCLVTMRSPAQPAPRPTALDLFCGVGGLSLGLTQAGFHLLGGVDSDAETLETHKANFPHVLTHECNLFKTPGANIRAALGLGNTGIDLLAGGPPCQGFSTGGARTPNDPRNRGIMAFARLVVQLEPRYFLMENVRGFMYQNHHALHSRFRRRLQDAGYTVIPFQVLNAADYGVPQRRERVFVLGCRVGESLPEYPAPAADPGPTVMDAIADLQAIDERAQNVDCDTYRGPLGKKSAYAKQMRRTLGRRPLRVLSGCLRTTHSLEVIERFNATPQGGQESVSHYFRLSWQGISPTIRAGTGPDHGSHTAPRPIHPELPRCITVREAARLHSFPDWFVFRGTRWHGFRQIGNSVPPLLGEAVARQVAAALARGEQMIATENSG